MNYFVQKIISFNKKIDFKSFVSKESLCILNVFIYLMTFFFLITLKNDYELDFFKILV